MAKEKGVIAAGHPETAKTAAEILRAGGNAFDAVVAAQFTAFVAEPVLTSLGGGGFMMAETPDGKKTLYDFFVQTPGQKKPPSDIRFYPIFADFGEVQQEYHVGLGSVAVPGMVKGLAGIHKDLCSLPLKTLAEQSVELARNGVVMNSFQSGVFDIIRPIYRSSEEPQRIFMSNQRKGKLIRDGERLKQPELADTLEQLTRQGEKLFYNGEIANTISEICRKDGGHVVRKDFENYQMVKRCPLMLSYRQNELFINPPPASGGILIAFALKLLESLTETLAGAGTASAIDLLAKVQRMTDKARMDAYLKNPASDPAEKLLDPDYLEQYKKEIWNKISSIRGTTQISIADRDGNLASLTSSNGEGSGVMIPETGIMLNNMLGEQDLNPGGFHNWQTNERVTSMMAPGILDMKNGKSVVFGSGGSNRIRTAILQVLLNIIDHEMPLEQAVLSPRIHLEEDELHIEGGIDPGQVSEIIKHYPNHRIWKKKALFFGGAHSVSTGKNGFEGAGDTRRGGVSVVC